MKIQLRHSFKALALLACCALHSTLTTADAQGTAFTYQGHLVSGTNAAEGSFDLTFELFNAVSGGSQVGATLTNLNVGVTNGLFTVSADFGAVYNGTAYWLQIGVRTNGGGTFTVLSPRQELTPTPYSITAQNVTGAVALAQLPSGLVTNDETNVAFVNLTISSNLTLPSPATIDAGGNSLLRSDNNNDFYAGPGAGSPTNSGSANTGIGVLSLQNNTNGTNNTAIGYASLGDNTNGAYNTALGERALASNASGNDNTAEGRHAMVNNTSGNDNTANGYQALASNTNGAYNTATGSSALASITSGSNNIALGYLAGNNYGEGESSNILIGSLGVGGDNNTIRIGSGQTQTFIAGVINANGGGLTNLNASQFSSSVVTNGEPNVSLGSLTLGGSLNLPQPVAITYASGFLSSSSFLYSGNNNLYLGPKAGNANTGDFNTGVGESALAANSTGTLNTALGKDALLNNTTGSYNTATGADALFSSAVGSYNTAVGAMALFSDGTISGVTGADNTATGALALYSNTSGSSNTASGAQALYSNTTGSNNSAFGINALYLNTTGGGNTASGSYALYSNSGNNNTADGYNSLNLNGGNYNTAQGYEALGAESAVPLTGNNNTASGAGALAHDTTGGNNTADGLNALFANTSGTQNTATGILALQGNTIGSYNTADGVEALYDNDTGSNNAAVGNFALYQNTTGNQNVAIGLSALGNSTTDNNLVAVGFQALQSDNAGNNSHTSDGNGHNTAIGYNALQADTTGAGNTANGYEALSQNQSGLFNTANGDNALAACISGSYNVALGTSTLENCQSDSNEVAVGYAALQNVQSGSNNVALGYNAGFNLMSGTDNIYIGSAGLSSESGIIRIGGNQTQTYLAGNVNCSSIDSAGEVICGNISCGNISTGGVILCPSVACLGPVTATGPMQCCSITINGGCDLAEPFPISTGKEQVSEGSVVVIDAKNPGELKLATRPYDTRVAGVISGANGINPGIQMQQKGLLEGGQNVALTGRVYVQADASNGPIEPGDLLTTSSEPGRAMKVTDHIRAQGAILGKAMTGLNEGQGMVLVLVTLQ